MNWTRWMWSGLRTIADGMAESLGYRRIIKLSEHRIKEEYAKPEDLEGEMAYDESHYVNGNIYIDGHANPVKPNEVEDKVELISSKRYKDFMQQDLAADIIRATEDEGNLKMLVMLSVIFSMVSASILGFIATMMFM